MCLWASAGDSTRVNAGVSCGLRDCVEAGAWEGLWVEASSGGGPSSLGPRWAGAAQELGLALCSSPCSECVPAGCGVCHPLGFPRARPPRLCCSRQLVIAY